MGMDSQIWGSNRINDRGVSWLQVLGKLKPGIDPSQAVSELNVEMQRIAARYPDTHLCANAISSDPLWRSPFGTNVYLYGTLPILLALAALLLLLACANVANLLLVRSVARRREMAIRMSMGANVYLYGTLPILLALAALLLLLACATVANLLLVRGVPRRRTSRRLAT